MIKKIHAWFCLKKQFENLRGAISEDQHELRHLREMVKRYDVDFMKYLVEKGKEDREFVNEAMEEIDDLLEGEE